MATAVVVVGESFKIALPNEVSRAFPISEGEKLYIVATEDMLLIRRVPRDLPEALGKLVGGFALDKKAKKRAEKWLLNHAEKNLPN